MEALHLRLGPLSGVVREALLFSFDLAAEGTPIEGARLEIEEVPVVVFCPACGEERPLPGIQSFQCPVCGTPTPDVVRGRELELATMEVSAHGGGKRCRPGSLRSARASSRRTTSSPASCGGASRPPASTWSTWSPAREPARRRCSRRTLTELRQPGCRVAALVGDLATDNDAQRLGRSGAPVRQIITGTVCHLDAEMVAGALTDWELESLDILFVENVGNLVCPASYDLGEDLRAVLLAVTEGEDKPLKYPTIFNGADLALITKIDLADAVEFERDQALRQPAAGAAGDRGAGDLGADGGGDGGRGWRGCGSWRGGPGRHHDDLKNKGPRVT